MKIDYELKAKMLSDSQFNDFRKYSQLAYKLLMTPKSAWTTEHDIQNYNVNYFFDNLDLDKAKEFNRLLHSRCCRVSRLKKRIAYMLSLSPCLFLTITFSDFHFSHYSEVQRRRIVRDFLSSFNCLYIANQDFGKEKGREHYHSVLGCESIDYHLWLDKYGSRIDGIKIGYGFKDIEKVSKYIAKLTNHAIKNTNKRSVIIYSKGFPKDL